MKRQHLLSSALIFVALSALVAGCSTTKPTIQTPAPSPAPIAVPANVPPEVVSFSAALHQWDPWTGNEGTTTVWYPSYLPTGYALDSIETTVADVENDSGPVCDVVFRKGKSRIWFAQGSPVMRDYEVTPLGEAPWGSASAFVMDLNDRDKFLVFWEASNLAELSGDTSLDELKKVAASMKQVP